MTLLIRAGHWFLNTFCLACSSFLSAYWGLRMIAFVSITLFLGNSFRTGMKTITWVYQEGQWTITTSLSRRSISWNAARKTAREKIKEGVHMNAVFWLVIMALTQISRLRFKQSSISLLIPHIYVSGRFVIFLVILGNIWRKIVFLKGLVKAMEIGSLKIWSGCFKIRIWN